MTVDIISLVVAAVVSGIGFLIRHWFVKFDAKLDEVVKAVGDIREKHGERLTALETDFDWLSKIRHRMSGAEQKPEPKR